MNEPFYSADITIPVLEIYAKSGKEAEDIIHAFIDNIALLMEDKLRWDDADWTIHLNTLEDRGWVSEEVTEELCDECGIPQRIHDESEGEDA